jgi:DnaJ-class molecular chaperone
MICETCKGDPVVAMSVDRDGNTMPIAVPCPDCGGCGFSHCCDGLQEQPEKLGEEAKR